MTDFVILATTTAFDAKVTAGDYYGDNTQLRHIRCYNPGVSKTYCRPFLDNSATLEAFDGDGCGQGESRSGNGSWATLAACKLNLNTAVACYETATTGEYFTVTPTANTCDPTSEFVILESAMDDTPADALAALSITDSATYKTAINIKHQRCNRVGAPIVKYLRVSMHSSFLFITVPANIPNCKWMS